MLDVDDNTTSDQHQMLVDHHNLSSYDGNVRALYAGVVLDSKRNVHKLLTNTTDQSGKSFGNHTLNSTKIQVYGLGKSDHFSALGITIAAGFSFLVLNIVIFAGIYYQRSKISLAKNLHKAYNEGENASHEEERKYENTYIMKDSHSSLILHDLEDIQTFKEQSMFDLVESSEIKRQLSSSSEIELITTSSQTKIKTVTFVDPPTILCEIPDPVLTDVIRTEQVPLKSLLKRDE